MKRCEGVLFGIAVLFTGLFVPGKPVEACTVNGATTACAYPPIDQSVSCPASFLPNAAPAGAPVNTILHRVTLSGAHATCNDGSPAVFYVRPSLGPGGWNKWLIVLEGGGTGFDPNGTLDSGMWDRWAGVGSTLNCVQNASTDWLDAAGAPGRDGVVDHPAEAVFPGILDVRNSAFAFWNLVFINYCSSDGWSGQAPGVDLDNAGPWTVAGDTYEGFRADFNGHSIIEEVIALLKTPLAWTPDENPELYMHDLDEAKLVLVAGESAGGGGVLNNLDWIAAQLPQADVRGSIGASHQPPIGAAGDPWFLDARPPVNGISDIEEGAEERLLQVDRINGFIDQSCRTTVAASDQWQCQLLSATESHLTTPHFIKQDMSDDLLSSPWVTWSAGGLSDYQAGILEDYDAWIAARTPRFFAPDCGHHASLNAAEYFDHTLQLYETPVGGGVGALIEQVNYDEALRRFIDGSSTGRFIHDGKVVFRFVPPTGVVRATWLSDCP